MTTTKSPIDLPDPSTPPDIGFEPTIGAAIRHRADVDPDTDYVVSIDQRMTYAEVERASAHLARRMLGMGIGKGSRVGLFFSYSVEWIVCWLAASRIGALVMPLSTVYAPRELGKAIRLGDIQVLFTSSSVVGRDTALRLAEALPELADADGPDLRLRDAPFLRHIWMTGAATAPWGRTIDLFCDAAPRDPEAELLATAEAGVVPGDLAVVVYTSGSSAEPKGVMHTHASVLLSSVIIGPMQRNYAKGLPPKVICGMPFFWVGGILTAAGALLEPITMIIMERFDPGDALELMERERATHVIAWPTLVDRMRAHPDFRTRDLSSASDFVSGGPDVALVDTPEPGVPMHRGMSESMGTFAGVESKIVDPATGAEVAVGEDGELCIRGYGVMAGYYKREWREVFDPDGWYHTGDKCFRVDGDSRIFYRGRFTEMIKSSGANVAPREVESIMEELSTIRHCFVLGLPDLEREEVVTAVVVPADPGDYEPQEAIAHARASLSAFKVPTRWIVVEAERIPWLGSGKPDKRALRELLLAGELGEGPGAQR